MVGLCVCLLVCVSVGHVREPIEMPFGADSCGPKEALLDEVKVGRSHSPPRGVTKQFHHPTYVGCSGRRDE